MTAPDSAGVTEARAAMREVQRQTREGLGVMRPISHGDSLATALQHAGVRERGADVRGEHVISGPFRYPLATERVRWARTRDIIQRASPGPDEDGRYLEMVARQAASVETVLRGECEGSPNPRLVDLCDRLLLGTLPTLDLRAHTHRHGEHFLVFVSAGLIDFTYQLAKAVVLSWKPVSSPRGGVAFQGEREHVEMVLREMPLPLELVRATVEHCLFEGVTRAPHMPAPPTRYHPPLAVLTAFNERFVIAHEIAHALHDEHDVVHARLGLRGEEFASDVWALRWAMESARQLDRMAPNMAAQGAFFTLTVIDLLHQAIDLARHRTVRRGVPFVGHPPTEHRLATLREAFGEMVTRADDEMSIRAALVPSNTLSLLWQRLIEDEVAASWQSRRVHRFWQDIG